MHFETPLLRGRFERRYKRFFADVTLDTGESVVSHCANSGSMKGCLEAGCEAWVSRAADPNRKLAYSLELLRPYGALCLVNTARPNALVHEAVVADSIPELAGYAEVRREVKYGDEASRIDLLLRAPDRPDCYVEVKSATMGVGGGLTRFPDAVTTRGTKHLRELAAMVRQGHRAVLLFCASRDDTLAVEPADDLDPEYGRTLRAVAEAGVEVLAYRWSLSPTTLELGARVPVQL
ncbi:MAG: DNA/RNA nuclease SfsA [Bradymonadia bacterium]|jgi:sugar fermentation stimulation protein A